MANIFQKAWETIKSIPEQWKAAYQIGTQGMANIAKEKLTAAIGIQTKPTLQIPVGQNLTPQAAQQAQQVVTGKIQGPTVIQAMGGSVAPTNYQTSPYQTYYQPSVTQPTTAYNQPTTTYNQPNTAYTPPPPQAPSGQAGVSYQPYQPSTQPISGYGYSYTPYAPSGQAGVSAHTGLLGGVTAGVGTGQNVSPTQTEEEKKKTMTIAPISLAQTNTAMRASMANLAPTGQPEVSTTSPAPSGLTQAQPKLSIPSFGTEGAIDFSDLGAVQNRITDIANALKSPQTQQTYSQFQQQLTDLTTGLTNYALQLKALPPEPILKPEAITDDPDQLDKLYNIEKQAYEDTQRALGIPDLITQYETTLAEINATDQAFSSIIKDVNDDPDFPKGLARRRIQAIEDEKGIRINQLTNKANLLSTTLQLKQQEFADRMGITQRAITRQENQQAQQKQDTQNQVSMLINSGGIADMSDAELTQLAQSAGYTLISLQKIRDAVKSGNETKLAKAQADLEKQQQSMDIAEQRLALAQEKAAGGGGKPTSDEKAIAYDKIKQRAIQLFADGATEAEYQQMRNEIIAGGLGSYIDDFDKFAQPLLPGKALSIEQVKISIIKTLQSVKDTYTRDEAKTAAENQLSTALGLKTGQTLPQTYQQAIEDALNEVYGQTNPWWHFGL